MQETHNLSTGENPSHARNHYAWAYFALGCFWSPDARFGSMPGIGATLVGYAGGSTPEPRYTQLGDHMETIWVSYDPHLCSYNQLLDIFFQVHNPMRAPIKRQYASAIFPVDAEQERQAHEARARYARHLGGTLATEIQPDIHFYPAEDYHQKFHLQQHPRLFKQLEAHFEHFDELVRSTLAARFNGWVSGFGTHDDIERELDALSAPEDLRNAARLLRPQAAIPTSSVA